MWVGRLTDVIENKANNAVHRDGVWMFFIAAGAFNLVTIHC